MAATATTAARTYNVAQQAARDYMQAQGTLDALAEQSKPAKAAQQAALDILADQFGADADHDVKVAITGCWNVPLTFLHRTDASVKWAKVVDALRPHLDREQAATLDRIIAANTGTRLTRNVKA